MLLTLGSIALLIVLLAGVYAAGHLVLSVVAPDHRPAERFLYALLLGAGVLGTVFLFLAAVGMLHPLLLWGIVVAFAGAGWRYFPELLSELRDVTAPLSAWSGLSATVTWAVFVGVAMVHLTGALVPVTDWDSLMYHLDIPISFLAEGRLHVPEDNLHVAYVGLWHMLYLPFLSAGTVYGPALLNATYAIVLGLALLTIGERLFGRVVAVGSFLMLWGSSSLVLIATTPRIDVSVACALILAHFALVDSSERNARGRFLLAGLLAGISISMKYQALVYITVLTPIAFYIALRERSDRLFTIRVLVSAAIAAWLVVLPWLIKNTVLLGSPFYPFFGERILPPWLAALNGSSAIPASANMRMFEALGAARDHVTLSGLIFNPASLSVEAEARAYATNPLFYLLPCALLFLRNRSVVLLVLPALAYLTLLMTVFQFTNLRYLVPIIPAFTLVCVAIIWLSLRHLLSDQNAGGVILLASLLLLFAGARAAQPELDLGSRVAVATGSVSQEEYLTRVRIPGFRTYYEAAKASSTATTASDRILLLFMARGYYFDRAVLQDNILTNWPQLVAVGASSTCLAGSGITHVMVNHGAAGYYGRRGADLNDLAWAEFPVFRETCLTLIGRSGYIELYRVGQTIDSSPEIGQETTS